MPQALVLVLTAVGAAIVVRLIAKEWRRVNNELNRNDGEPAPVEREAVPNLRRDPATGVYHPSR